MTTCYVLAGGKGSRLFDWHSAKILAPIAGRPFVHLLVESLIDAGVNDLVFLVNHFGEDVVSEVEGMGLDIPYEFVFDKEPDLGTCGSLYWGVKARAPRGNAFIAVNGDTLVRFSVADVLAPVSPIRPVSLLVSKAYSSPREYGSVFVEHGYVTGFAEKAGFEDSLISAGVYGFHIGFPFPPFKSIERDLFPSLARGLQIGAVLTDQKFYDIGTPARRKYLNAVVANRVWRMRDV